MRSRPVPTVQFVVLSTAAILLCAAAAGCGGGGAPGPGAPTATEKEKLPAWKLGHYSSPDGLVGAVIDRTGDKPKLRLDGSRDVVQLHLEKQEERGESSGHWLNGPDGKHWLFLGERGELSFIKAEARGDAELKHRIGFVPLTRDAAADALGTATQIGIATPPTPKRPYQVWADKLAQASVVTKLGMKPEDSGNLAKVGEAFHKATPEMFVHVNAKAAAHATWHPASALVAGVIHAGGGDVMVQALSEEAWDKNKPGLKRYGIELLSRPQFGDPTRVRQAKLKGWPPALPSGTPGIVWDVRDGSTVVFVALDGGRWELSGWINEFDKAGPIVDAGAGPSNTWPVPFAASTLDAGIVKLLADAGAIPNKTAEEIDALDDGYFECVNKVWKEGRAEADKIEASQASYNDKLGRITGVRKKYEQKAVATCADEVKRYEDGLVKVIEARDAERKALFDKARAKAAASK